MAEKVLVAYGSKYGATAELAGRIAQALEQAGLVVALKPAGQAGRAADYDAVVLGSAVYMGQWQKEAAAWLEANRADLAGRPTWLFSSGPTGPGDPEVLLEDWRLPEKLKPAVEQIQPRGVAVFGGKMDPAKLNFFEKLVLKMIKAPVGDFRDWARIEAWAAGIAGELRG
ncbi:MAG: flavodoxin domain-containing protein [Anaerolineaceae bacterium]|nr:flavodoxin domain-containing protein [Anaerolineaceae bacterium]